MNQITTNYKQGLLYCSAFALLKNLLFVSSRIIVGRGFMIAAFRIICPMALMITKPEPLEPCCETRAGRNPARFFAGSLKVIKLLPGTPGGTRHLIKLCQTFDKIWLVIFHRFGKLMSSWAQRKLRRPTTNKLNQRRHEKNNHTCSSVWLRRGAFRLGRGSQG